MKKIFYKLLSLTTAALLLLQLMPSLTFAAPSESDYGKRLVNIVRNAQNQDDELLIQNEIPVGGAGGNLNETVQWTLTDDGTLTFSGAGAIDYEDSGDMPWIDYIDEIEKIVIGSGITKIYLVPFTEFLNIEEIEVEEENGSYCSIDGALFNKDKTVLEFFPAGSSVDQYTVPSTVNTLSSSSFCGCENLENVVIPPSVKTIELGAFMFCTALESVKIPFGVTIIEDYTFAYCSALESVSFPGALTSIGECAFSECEALSSVTIPPMVTNIGAYAFNSIESETTYLETAKFMGDAPELGEDAFDSSKVKINYIDSKSGWNASEWQDFVKETFQCSSDPNISGDEAGNIDVLDLILMKQALSLINQQHETGTEEKYELFDIDGSGTVDNDDLLSLMQIILNQNK